MGKKRLFHFGKVTLFILDLLLIAAICLAVSLIMGGAALLKAAVPELFLFTGGTLIALLASGAYRRMLNRLSVRDLAFGVLAITASCAVGLTFTAVHNVTLMPYAVFCFLLFMLEFVATRLTAYFMLNHIQLIDTGKKDHPVLIVGAGTAGVMLAKELLRDPEKGSPLYFCDDDENKIGMTIEGIRVVSSTMLIPDVCEKYGIKTIYIAIPSAAEAKIKSIQDLCKKTSCVIYYLPLISSLVTSQPFVKQSRKLQYSEVLGREEISLQSQKMIELINNRVVLVTGGGGSIGSELCRQIADLGPRQLIIVDIYENNAYDIQQDLIIKNPGLNLSVEIA